MATFESQNRRMPKIEACLKAKQQERQHPTPSHSKQKKKKKQKGR